MGVVRARLTLCPVSHLSTPLELAYLLAKSRPGMIITTTGPSGIGMIREAMSILDKEDEIQTLVQGKDSTLLDTDGRRLLAQWLDEIKRHLPPPVATSIGRILTVDVDGEADYYGTGTNASGVPVGLDLFDWTRLLSASATDVATLLPASTMYPKEQEQRVAVVIWSSGTTGLRKGVLHTHKTLITACIMAWARKYEAGPWRNGGERWVAVAPFCHIFGFAAVMLPALAQGATLILPPAGRFNLKTYLRLLSDHRATWAAIAPPGIIALRDTNLLKRDSPEYLDDLDLSALKGFVAGGAPVAPEVIITIWKRMGKYVQMGFGTSETLGLHQARGITLIEGLRAEELGSSGQLISNYEVEIRPDEEQQALPTSVRETNYQRFLNELDTQRKMGRFVPRDPCMPGEVLIKGSGVMRGYYSGRGSDEGDGITVDSKLQPFTKDGWYRTGDTGVHDKHGNLWILGRSKETFKVKGFQVAPSELDSLFATHPAVADVAASSFHEAEQGTDVVILYVQPVDETFLPPVEGAGSSRQQEDLLHRQRALVQELSQWTRSRSAYYKWPRYYVLVPTIPKNAAGKTLRKELHSMDHLRVRAPKSVSAKL